MLARVDEIEALLVARGVDVSAIGRARSIADANRVSLLRILNQMGELADDTLADIVSILSGFATITPDQLAPIAIECPLSKSFMRAKQLLPIRERDGVVDVAYVNALDDQATAGVRFALGSAVGESFVITAGDWKQAFNRLYETGGTLTGMSETGEDQLLVRLFDQDRDAPVARKIASLLTDAVMRGASDIHIETHRNSVDVRFRIDGRLKQVAEEPVEAAAALIARVKVLADLNLGERRRPQDGRTTIVVAGRPVDVRVSIVPAVDGESAVLRLLDRPKSLLTLEGLGFSPAHSDTLQKMMKTRDGLFLVAGPTGSGKTTTLYACLQMLAVDGLKILSIEDPIEYHFGHVTQVQTSEATGLDFPTALRSFLRHDPDVILVGEIRDPETARIAVQAALTGHLVVASIHAIDCERIVPRLIDMGVDRYQVDAALRSALAQRLVRALCQTCSEARSPTAQAADVFANAGLEVPTELAAAIGCETCGGTGYQGRIVIAEMLGSEDDILRDGLRKVMDGKTTVAEVLLAVSA